MNARTHVSVILFIPFVLVLCPIWGCSNLLNQHAQFMDAMRGAMKDTASRLGESGTGQIAAGGQVIAPGLRMTAGMEYFVEARYVGVAGQVTASMHGGLDRPVPPEVQAQVDAIWRDTSLSDAEKLSLVHDLLMQWVVQAAMKSTGETPVPQEKDTGSGARATRGGR